MFTFTFFLQSTSKIEKDRSEEAGANLFKLSSKLSRIRYLKRQISSLVVNSSKRSA